MGLKLAYLLFNRLGVGAFNRTTVGLKRIPTWLVCPVEETFNRTTVGLKHRQRTHLRTLSTTFNRTTVGLKL